MADLRHQRRKTLSLQHLAACKTQRAHRAAVKGPKKGDHLRTARVVAGQFERRFHRFGAAVREKNPFASRARSELSQFFGQIALRSVVEIGARHVQQPLGLLLDRGDDPGMAMACRTNGDAGGKVEKAIAVDIFNHGPISTGNRQRVGPCIRRGRVRFVVFDQFAGGGTGQLGAQARCFGMLHKRQKRVVRQAVDRGG
jgi:hypothetical protein